MNIKSWIKASRLPAQLFIFPSLLLGQAIAFRELGNFNGFIFSLVFVFGIGLHFFIVYANDYADYETDLKNDTFTPFTGGSRVLVEGELSKKSLLNGIILMIVIVLTLATIKSILVNNVLIVVFAFIGLFLLHAYSYYPIKLSYRGFGESLQMLGVGLVLPIIGFISQGGMVSTLPIEPILMLLPSQLAMAIGTSLPDQPSDALSKKRTSAVILGVKGASVLMLLLFGLSLGLSTMVLNDRSFLTATGFILSIFSFSIMALIILIKSPKPGTNLMFVLTGLSILTNTMLVLTYITYYF